MSFRPLSNHQNVVKTWDSRLNFYKGTILVSEFVNCVRREGSWGWRATTTVSASGVPVYRWQRLNQIVLRIFPRYSVVTRELLPATQPFITRHGHATMEEKQRYRAVGQKVKEWLDAWKSTNIRSKSAWSDVSKLTCTQLSVHISSMFTFLPRHTISWVTRQLLNNIKGIWSFKRWRRKNLHQRVWWRRPRSISWYSVHLLAPSSLCKECRS
jgi:hypothetical protein